MRELTDKINFLLNERRKTTKTEMTVARRELKKEKSRDTSVDLYDDIVRFLSTHLNSMDTKDLVKFKVMTRKKAIEMITGLASSVPEAQAMLDKMHLEPEKFVSRYWTLKDMKIMIQDSVDMLLKGEKPGPVAAPKEEKSVEPKKN